MPQGLYTQTVCILLEQPVSLDEVAQALSSFEIKGRAEAEGHWAYSGPKLLLKLGDDEHSAVVIDVVDHPWPDEMGDPQNSPEIFSAWGSGQFGPFTFPGGLARAVEQSWISEEVDEASAEHRAFIRIRSTYALAATDESDMFPEGYEPDAELETITRVAAALLELPAARYYFNPNGEVIRNQDGLRESLNFGWSNDLPPLDAWVNVRLFRINDEWALMDTVGAAQLDLPDLEACYFSDAYDPSEVENLLRNISLYLMEEGEVIEDGDTLDGPGSVAWQVMLVDDPLSDPPRDVLRWIPLDDRPVPDEVLQYSEEGDDKISEDAESDEADDED